jgi:hypothetical protein
MNIAHRRQTCVLRKINTITDPMLHTQALNQLTGANLTGYQVHPTIVCVALTVGGVARSTIEDATSYRASHFGCNRNILLFFKSGEVESNGVVGAARQLSSLLVMVPSHRS